LLCTGPGKKKPGPYGPSKKNRPICNWEIIEFRKIEGNPHETGGEKNRSKGTSISGKQKPARCTEKKKGKARLGNRIKKKVNLGKGKLLSAKGSKFSTAYLSTGRSGPRGLPVGSMTRKRLQRGHIYTGQRGFNEKNCSEGEKSCFKKPCSVCGSLVEKDKESW